MFSPTPFWRPGEDGFLGASHLTHNVVSRPSSKHNWHPTRLLDIGEEGSTSWKLRVVSKDGIPSPSAAYLTLSYRWAHKPNAILLSSNIASFRYGSPISGLPILFREFISIA